MDDHDQQPDLSPELSARDAIAALFKAQLRIWSRRELTQAEQRYIRTGTFEELVLWAKRLALGLRGSRIEIFAERIDQDIRVELAEVLRRRFGELPADVEDGISEVYEPHLALEKALRGDKLESILFSTIAAQMRRLGFLQGYLEAVTSAKFGAGSASFRKQIDDAPLESLLQWRDDLQQSSTLEEFLDKVQASSTAAEQSD